MYYEGLTIALSTYTITGYGLSVVETPKYGKIFYWQHGFLRLISSINSYFLKKEHDLNPHFIIIMIMLIFDIINHGKNRKDWI
jgi:hypothetical protein